MLWSAYPNCPPILSGGATSTLFLGCVGQQRGEVLHPSEDGHVVDLDAAASITGQA
jgi:hypothetical protein